MHNWFASRLWLCVLLLAAVSSSTSRAQTTRLCFPTVPAITNCIEGRFLEYWQQNGGLPVFGYPITAAANQRTAEGTFLVQYFERNSFELHPDKARPYDVLLGRLGATLLERQGINWQNLPKASPTAPHYFATTGHAVTHEPFWQYWSSHGLQDPSLSADQRSLALFGMPLTEAATATNPNGDTVLTQWFERARFEWHPNNPPEFQVLLGLLGNEDLATAPSPNVLVDTQWVLTTLAGQTPLSGTTITAAFGSDASVSGSDGCNNYSATYTATGTNIAISGPFAGTQRACADQIMQQATLYRTALTQATTYAIEGSQLTLRDANGRVLATFTAQPTGLAGTSWTVLSYNNGTGGVVSVINGTTLTATFSDTQVSGSSGCNDYSGAYQSDGRSTITFGPLAGTRMFCAEPAGLMDQEARYLAALQSAATYTRSGNNLEMRTASGALAATFRR